MKKREDMLPVLTSFKNDVMPLEVKRRTEKFDLFLELSSDSWVRAVLNSHIHIINFTSNKKY